MSIGQMENRIYDLEQALVSAQAEPGQDARELAYAYAVKISIGLKHESITIAEVQSQLIEFSEVSARLSRPEDCTCGFSEKESDRCKAHDRHADAALRNKARKVIEEGEEYFKLCGKTWDPPSSERGAFAYSRFENALNKLRAALAASPEHRDEAKS